MKRGHIHLWRNIQESWLWKERRPRTKLEAWLDLCLMAEGKPDGQLPRGTLVVSKSFLSRRWLWPRTNVFRFLQKLEKTGAISIDRRPDTQPDTQPDQITIRNYGLYNPMRTPNRTPNRTQFNKVQESLIPPLLSPPEKPATKNGASIVLDRCLQLEIDAGNTGLYRFPRIRSKKIRAQAEKRIGSWLEDGYSADELVRYAEVYLSKARAHTWFERSYPERELRHDDRFWCPARNWTLVDAFGGLNSDPPKRFAKYGATWIDEGPITKEELMRFSDHEWERQYS